jgi:hypothetical protein
MELKLDSRGKVFTAFREKPKDGRVCGDCSVCCKVFPVPELDKPADTWCRHCQPGKGCGIYHQQRPKVCGDYTCMWLGSDLPENWKPNRCKFVMTEQRLEKDGKPHLRLQVMVDATYPHAWRKEPFFSTFKAWAKTGKGRILIFIGLRCIEILASGEEREHRAMSLEEIQEKIGATTDDIMEFVRNRPY